MALAGFGLLLGGISLGLMGLTGVLQFGFVIIGGAEVPLWSLGWRLAWFVGSIEIVAAT